MPLWSSICLYNCREHFVKFSSKNSRTPCIYNLGYQGHQPSSLDDYPSRPTPLWGTSGGCRCCPPTRVFTTRDKMRNFARLN